MLSNIWYLLEIGREGWGEMERNYETKQNRGLSQMNDDKCHILQDMINSIPCICHLINRRKKKPTTQNHWAAGDWHFHSCWLLTASSHKSTFRFLGLAPRDGASVDLRWGYRMGFICLTCSKQNTETQRLAAEKRSLYRVAKWRDGRTNLSSASRRWGPWGIYGIMKQSGVRLRKGDWSWGKGEVIGVLCSCMSYMLFLGKYIHMRMEFSALWHQKVTHGTPVQAQFYRWCSQPVLASFNWTGANPKSLESNWSPPITIVTKSLTGVIYMGG